MTPRPALTTLLIVALFIFGGFAVRGLILIDQGLPSELSLRICPSLGVAGDHPQFGCQRLHFIRFERCCSTWVDPCSVLQTRETRQRSNCWGTKGTVEGSREWGTLASNIFTQEVPVRSVEVEGRRTRIRT